MIAIASISLKKQRPIYTQDDSACWSPTVGSSNSYGPWTNASTLSEVSVWNSPIIVARKDMPLSKTVHLRKVTSGKRDLVFDKGLSLELRVTRDANHFVVSDESFGFYGTGCTYEDALADYSSFFIDFFEDIVGTPNRELPSSTREFKRTLSSFCRLVSIG